MIIAAPILIAVGGFLTGLLAWALDRHHRLISLLLLAFAATCLTIGFLGNTITIPKPQISIQPHSSQSP